MSKLLPPKIKKIDVLGVYPQGKRTYHGKKWGVAHYELAGEVKGVIDFPLPPECDDIHPVAIAAIMNAVTRGVYDGVKYTAAA